jgi:hypothetical protein
VRGEALVLQVVVRVAEVAEHGGERVLSGPGGWHVGFLNQWRRRRKQKVGAGLRSLRKVSFTWRCGPSGETQHPPQHLPPGGNGGAPGVRRLDSARGGRGWTRVEERSWA